jgi:HSP20 family protein
VSLLMEPFGPLAEFQRDFSRLVGGGTTPAFLPLADVRVTQDDVMVRMDVPGMTADDLEIELQEDVLTIRGERKDPWRGGETDNGTWHRVERAFGRWERSLRLPAGLDPDAIEANLADGVLTMRIPKPEPLKPRRIAITKQAEQRQLEDVVA